MVLDSVRSLWPLSEHYEYASEVGLSIRNHAPGWWQTFAQETDLDALALPQAQGYAFLVFLENHPEIHRPELEKMVVAAVSTGAARLSEELVASVACDFRDVFVSGDPFEPAELNGEKVALWTPEACVGYPNQFGEQLDLWTQLALMGADVTEQTSEWADAKDFARVHAHSYVEGLQTLCSSGGGLLTPETVARVDSWPAVRAAAGAVQAAAAAALTGSIPGVPLCLVRPGSHHAERYRAGGTCLINNLAVAAAGLLQQHKLSRIAIVDVDAHHGNGTEDIFREEGRVFCLSIHQHPPFFPGTGSTEETGRGAGSGTNLNIPVAPEDNWLQAFEVGLYKLARFRPQLILVEFSTDAHRADPVSDLQLSDEDYETAVRMLKGLGAPLVFELGSSLSERAWIGGVRAAVRGASS